MAQQQEEEKVKSPTFVVEITDGLGDDADLGFALGITEERSAELEKLVGDSIRKNKGVDVLESFKTIATVSKNVNELLFLAFQIGAFVGEIETRKEAIQDLQGLQKLLGSVKDNGEGIGEF